ncbi:hypothetical protein Pelo_8922 [Pelomyxa schiedti]|nr:hypothetical protein Pelo_8922 [Pelomyxa schiedti]
MGFSASLGSVTRPMKFHRRLLLTEYNDVCSVHDGNHKWWVHCNKDGMLSVVRIMGSESGNVQLDGALPEGPECVSISFNKAIPDEALLILEGAENQLQILMVVDVNQTHTRKELVVLSLTRREVEESRKHFLSGIAMKKANGQRAFFVEVSNESGENRAVYQVKESVGAMRPISRKIQKLSQLSHSQFCISRRCDQGIEIWDCNDTAAPLRVIAMRHFGVTFPVIAESGFLFHNRGESPRPGADVTDSTGYYVGSFTFEMKKSEVHVNALP